MTSKMYYTYTLRLTICCGADAIPKAGAVPAAMHDDAGNMLSGAGTATLHDDAGNVTNKLSRAGQSAVEAQLVLGYDGPEVRRVANVMQVAFWTSVPLFAVYLAASPSDGRLGWLGLALWCVAVVSSGFLTVKLGLPASSLEEGRELPEPGPAKSPGRASEWLVYALVLYLAVYLFAAQTGVLL